MVFSPQQQQQKKVDEFQGVRTQVPLQHADVVQCGISC